MKASILTLAIALLSCYVLFQTFLIVKVAVFSKLNHIPGPKYARWTNLVLKLQVLQGRRTQYIHSLHQKYGHFVRISPNEISISDLESFRTIHRIGSGFRKSDWYSKFTGGGPPGIFAMTDPKQHTQRRRLFAQAFSNTGILQYESTVRAKTELAIAKIKRDATCANADILQWFTFMATDVSGELSFGKSFDMLELEQKTSYIRDLETTMMISGIRSELPVPFAIASLLPIPALRHARQLVPRLHAYGEKAIQNLRAHTFSKIEGVAVPPSLFSKFLDTDKNQGLSDYEIAREASNLIVAGSDTTAISLTYLIYTVLLPENASIKHALLEEIARLPEATSAAELGKLTYLRAVVDESLRLFGAAPATLPRVVPKEGAVLGEYELPSGTTVGTQAFTIHRDPAIFEDPERFWPERWLNPTKSMQEAFHPFGAGSRTCIGVHLAILELTLATFLFFKSCPTARLAASATPEPMEMENYFLIAPRGHRCEIVL